MVRARPLARLRGITLLLAVTSAIIACAGPTISTSPSEAGASSTTPRPSPRPTPGALATPPATPTADGVYLAIGDSVTFGIGVPRPAEEGFVARVADALRDGDPAIDGTRVFAVPGETAGGFLDRRLDDVVTAIEALGPRVALVTVGLGANELLRARRDPACGADVAGEACRAVAAQAITEAATALDATVAAIRGTLDANASDAPILLLAYYSPETDALATETIVGPDGVVGCDAGAPRPGLNDAIACIAERHGATLVDLHAAFLGRELELTRIASGDVHPSAEGYAVIADAIVAALGRGR